jgi:transcriptional regulator of heat shock response
MEIRKELILGIIIKNYIDTAKPVSSFEIAEDFKIKVSTATIRNEMKELEEEDYIYQPYTSAGRVPTDKGYRYFVDTLMRERELNTNEQKALQTELLKLRAQNNRMAKNMAKMISLMSNNLALSGIVDSESVWDFGMSELLKNPEFKETDKVCQVAELLEHIDENIERLSEQTQKNKIEVFIGKENPLASAESCSMILSGIKFPSGEKGIIAVVGPKRMRYSKNISLVKYVKRLLGSEFIFVFALIII